MRDTNLFKRIIACALIFLLTVPFTATLDLMRGYAAAQSSEKVFKQEELEQLLASIALYPDALLAQVLTAATYPIEVVAADRFVKENQGLKGEALLEAAKDRDWEPSVKAMLGFPDVLAMMDEQLEWTGKLGDAFLSQQSDCMDTVQRLRQKAYAQGNLTTTEKQVIRVEPQTEIIIIEPATPEIVYVPVYDPSIIYGNWWYPEYQPYYFYTRTYTGISFFSGFFMGAFWGAWDCNWHSRDVYINVVQYNNFTKTSYIRDDRYRSYKLAQGDQPWKFDPRHRSSVTVRPSTSKLSSSDFRQYDQVTVKSPSIDVNESVRPSISKEITVEKPVINAKERAKPSINVPKSSGKDQASKKILPATELKGINADRVNEKPAVTVDSKNNTRNQKSSRISTGDLRIQEFAKPSAETKSPKESVKNKKVARPTSDDSRRKNDNVNIPAAKSRGIIAHAENADLQANRQFATVSNGSNVLPEGLMRAGGR